ncbi:MEDS domain-containing protein [Streptomyces ficellus]|uniref:MEDS domain-containing protein n=1 Tax=Streptomyces ficellus TaxID=1977088 RepID=A0A6I6FIU6_9ACTN|nr:MEDS domain-containing protein [Streptomyces ficellus]QGV77438.1 hypothetical protein EIZ62_03610 [Streptomyces ficellus]
MDPLAGDEHPPGTLPVQHMGPGHHAFLAYDDEAPGWDVLAAFVRAGLARGEKVIVFGPPRLTEAQVRSRLDEAPGTPATPGYERTQLELSSMRELILPARRFTADRQWRRIAEESGAARDDGYTGLRTYIDMGWVADLGAGLDMMMDRERRAGHLFTDGFYSEVCAYDRRRFPEAVLEAMYRAHPENLLPGLGRLRCLHGRGALRVVGEADTATYGQFARALARLLADPAPGPLTVDLLRTAFLGARAAAELAGLPGRAPAGRTVRIRCSRRHARLLRHLGADPAVLDVTE